MKARNADFIKNTRYGPDLPAACQRYLTLIMSKYVPFKQTGLNYKDCAFRYLLPVKSVLFRILRFCAGQSCGL